MAGVEITGTFGHVTRHPPRGPEPERYEVEVVVAFDDVGPQPILLQAYELEIEKPIEPGDVVTAVSEGSRLTIRRR
jgi:hypothetical protein